MKKTRTRKRMTGRGSGFALRTVGLLVILGTTLCEDMTCTLLLVY